jgi:hypothetical protein
MSAAPDPMQSLPDDIAALRALVLATMAERDAVTSERDALQQQNDRLRHLLLKCQSALNSFQQTAFKSFHFFGRLLAAVCAV